jgi:transcriptional regulator GlxA family with amidase domain
MRILNVLFSSIILFSCATKEAKKVAVVQTKKQVSKFLKPFNANLPTIGLLMYNGVLTTEVTATADVFTKLTKDGKQLFNVLTIGQTEEPILSEEGLQIIPEYTFENCPKLTALFVPSAYDMFEQINNKSLVEFIQTKNKETKYTVSNCGGAQLIGASGIAEGKKIVTWIGGGIQLQKDYPKLLVQNDSLVTFVEDGKFLSSNGNLASYVSALELLEKMTNKKHRKFVESYIYLERIQNWKR